ncbi:hypothetical protein [Mammaliicoccus vitulinus]|uniref:hypothetical protein n=1 Tax=Mammaliicoccus vitulinus TaxID=71237 RepID=UPI00248B5394|nr:hypothetical protein [Mammaliicoccus vitulinus]
MLSKETRKILKETGLTKKDLKIILLDNFVKNYRDGKFYLDLSYLDFSDFDGDVDISEMKVKRDLFQDLQKVQGHLWQDCQKVEGNLYQSCQEVEGDLYSDESKLKEDK